MTDDSIIAADDLKRRRILEGAAKVFLSYGFQRTTMDDIARAADMSRPALYLLFRNKTEIYRAIAETYLKASADQARVALRGEGAFAERLTAAVEGLIAMMEEFSASPHGAEILDMKTSLAADIVAEWRAEMTRLTADAIAREASVKSIDFEAKGLSVEALANLFWDGIEGMKNRAHDADGQRQAARVLARVVAGVVEPQ